MNQNYEKLKKDLENLIDKFNKGWHEGIEIDASDIMLLNDLMEALSAIANAPTVEQDSEPVLYWNGGSKFCTLRDINFDKRTGGTLSFGCDIPLYTSPQQHEWVGLSDENVLKILDECAVSPYTNKQTAFGYAKAIEAKLKELNHD